MRRSISLDMHCEVRTQASGFSLTMKFRPSDVIIETVSVFWLKKKCLCVETQINAIRAKRVQTVDKTDPFGM